MCDSSRSRRGAVLAAAAATLIAGAGQAATRTFAFTGTVSTLTRDGGLFGAPGTVQIGDPFTGHVRYETGASNPDQQPDPEVGGYALLELVVDPSVLPPFPPLAIGVLHEPGGATLPPTPPDPGRDWFLARATSDVYPTVSLRLQGPYGSAFTDDSLPETLDLADFPDAAVIQGLVAVGLFPNPSIEDVGTLTSLTLVPEPGGGGIVACLALFGVWRRGRR